MLTNALIFSASNFESSEVALTPLGKRDKNQPPARLFLEMSVSEAVHQRGHYSSIGLAQPGIRLSVTFAVKHCCSDRD
jgi:hypothetical protein